MGNVVTGSEQALCPECKHPVVDCTHALGDEWLRRYRAALDEGYSMSAAIHKANGSAP